MRLVFEYRIPMPLSVEEQHVGLRFMVMEGMYRYVVEKFTRIHKMHRETGGGAGTLFLENLPYSLQDYPEVCQDHQFGEDSENKEGVYTYKTHHPGNRLPWFVEAFFPKDKLVMHEETWNSHPFFLAIFTLPEFFGPKFCTTVKSKIITTEPKGKLEVEENTFCLSPEDLEKRKMTTLNIADNMFEPKNLEGESPDSFQSRKRIRGPLGKDWQDSDVLSVTHMLITVDLAGPDIYPNKLISFGERMIRKFMWRYYRELFLMMDDWIDLSTEEIVRLEEECMRVLPIHMLEEAKEDATSWM